MQLGLLIYFLLIHFSLYKSAEHSVFVKMILENNFA